MNKICENETVSKLLIRRELGSSRDVSCRKQLPTFDFVLHETNGTSCDYININFHRLINCDASGA